MKILILSLLSFLIISASYGVDSNYGTVVESPRYNSLIKKVHLSYEGKALGTCSGTFVSRKAFMTAKHCLDGLVNAVSEISEIDFTKIGFVIFDYNIASRKFHTVCYEVASKSQCLDLMFIEFPVQNELKDFFQSDLTYYSKNDFFELSGGFLSYGRGISDSESGFSDGVLRKSKEMNFGEINGIGKLIFKGAYPGILSGDSGGPLFKDETIYGVSSHVSANSESFSFAHFQHMNLQQMPIGKRLEMSILTEKLDISYKFKCECNVTEYETTDGMVMNPYWEIRRESVMALPVPLYTGLENRCSLLTGVEYVNWNSKKSYLCF